MDTLLTLAEVAIAMAGFSAVVVIFKRRDTNSWQKRDANRFHGMVIHAVVASLFCFLPFLVVQFTQAEIAALRWCSGLLSILTAVQLAAAIRFEISSTLWVKAQLLGIGPFIAALLGANAFWEFSEYALGVYMIGVFWHVLQAAILFVLLIWIGASQIETD